MSDLLKEAIADAKAVRTIALANAKVALEEAFAPRFHAMFANKLKEEAEQEETKMPEEEEAKMPEENSSRNEIDELIKELEAEVGKDESPEAPGGGMPPMGGAEETPPSSDVPVETPPGAGVGAPIPAGVPVIIQPVDQAGAGAGSPPVPPTPPPSEVPETPETGAGTPEEDEEINLDELLESLKEEYEEEEEQDECIKENVPVKSSGIGGGKAGGADNKAPSADSTKSSHIETASKDIKSGKVGYPDDSIANTNKIAYDSTEAPRPNEGPNATKTNLSTPGGALKEEKSIKSGKVGFPDGDKTSSGDDPTVGVDRPNEGEHATKDDFSTPGGALKEENAKLRKQLSEAYDTVKYIKGQLNEINLLNAKLLYTNKLLKEFNMNNEQKMRIVEMFDLSKTVREVRLTYATIAESLNFSGEMKKKAPANASIQSITEGIASKAVGSTKPSKEIITEGKFAARMKQLAGIRSEVKK